MPLKYQSEIDNFALSIACPQNVLPPTEKIEAFRFSFSPVENTLNFLPNVVFDRLKKLPFNYSKASEPIKCDRCGASYYTTLNNAKSQWNNLTEQNRENLGYTHIAGGELHSSDGLMKKPAGNGHFGFYENESAELYKKFNLVIEL